MNGTMDNWTMEQQDNILQSNNEAMNESKGTYTKTFKKITYKYSDYNGFWYDSLIDDLEYLLDIKWVDFIWWNKNTRNYNNILENYLDEDWEIDISLSKLWYIQTIYDDFIDKIEEAKYCNENIEKETNEEEKKKMKNMNERYEKYKKEITFEKFKKVFDEDDILVKIDLRSFENSGEIECYEDDNYYFIEKLWIIEYEDLNDISNALTDAIERNETLIYERALDEYDIIDVEATGYSQWDREEYVIFVNKEDKKKIEKAIWIKYKDWKKKIEFYLGHLFTVADIDINAVYEYTYFDEEWNEIERENKEEYMTNVILYWNETQEEEEEIVREKVNDYWDIKINENTIIEHEQ